MGFDVPKHIPMPQYAMNGIDTLRIRVCALCGDVAGAQSLLLKIQSSNAAYVLFARAVVQNLNKEHNTALKTLAEYRTLIGDDTIAYLEEAKALAATKGEEAAIERLQTGLSVFPGDEALLRDLERRSQKK